MAMQKNILQGAAGGFILSCLMILNGCHEVGPAIDLTDTVYDTYTETPEAPQSKVVLIEDFTGTNCSNCPTAHEAINATVAAHPGAVAVIAEYNYAGDPLGTGPLFWTDEALDLESEYLPVLGWPATFIDRYDFDADGAPEEVPANILPYTEEQLLKTPPVNIYLDKTYDTGSRTLDLTVTIKYTSDITTSNHLSVSLVENGIITDQLSGATILTDYEENHVLRKMLTFYLGDALPEENTAGRVYVFHYTYVVPDGFVAENMEAIAFVHNFETGNKEVLQAGSINITD